MHLSLDPLLKAHLARGKHLSLNVRAEIARNWINGLVFLFNAERKGWAHGASLLVKAYSRNATDQGGKELEANCHRERAFEHVIYSLFVRFSSYDAVER
jgi:hypothetical protein